MKYRESFSVEFSYDVIFTRNVFAPGNESLVQALGTGPARLAFCLDQGLVEYWPKLPAAISEWCELHRAGIELAGPVQIVPGGEKVKAGLDILDEVGAFAMKAGLCRHCYVVIVGGGAVLDAVGFAAGTIHRGMRQIRLPTTALSQADCGVGVKNALNRFGIKNYYGTFAPPWAVINDTEFLRTLSLRDWTSGLAEAFKVAIIKDRSLLDFLSENAESLLSRDQHTMEEVISRCATLHLEHIRTSGDPFECGSARPLDFGHWAAHELESMTDYELRHGEAVAIGIALDLASAVELGLLKKADFECVVASMQRCGLKLWHEALKRSSDGGELHVLEGIEHFRQHLGGKLTLAMPDGLGRKTDINDLPRDVVIRAIAILERRARECAGKERISHTV